MDPASLSAILLSVISLTVVFIKAIRKCKCNSAGIEIERRDDTGREEQYSFILELVKSLKTNFTPRKRERSEEDESTQSHEVTTEVPPLEIVTHKTTTKDIADHLDMIPRDSVSTSIPISEIMSNSLNNSHTREVSESPRFTPFIINRKK